MVIIYRLFNFPFLGGWLGRFNIDPLVCRLQIIVDDQNHWKASTNWSL